MPRLSFLENQTSNHNIKTMVAVVPEVEAKVNFFMNELVSPSKWEAIMNYLNQASANITPHYFRQLAGSISLSQATGYKFTCQPVEWGAAKRYFERHVLRQDNDISAAESNLEFLGALRTIYGSKVEEIDPQIVLLVKGFGEQKVSKLLLNKSEDIDELSFMSAFYKAFPDLQDYSNTPDVSSVVANMEAFNTAKQVLMLLPLKFLAPTRVQLNAEQLDNYKLLVEAFHEDDQFDSFLFYCSRLAVLLADNIVYKDGDPLEGYELVFEQSQSAKQSSAQPPTRKIY